MIVLGLDNVDDQENVEFDLGGRCSSRWHALGVGHVGDAIDYIVKDGWGEDSEIELIEQFGRHCHGFSFFEDMNVVRGVIFDVRSTRFSLFKRVKGCVHPEGDLRIIVVARFRPEQGLDKLREVSPIEEILNLAQIAVSVCAERDVYLDQAFIFKISKCPVDASLGVSFLFL